MSTILFQPQDMSQLAFLKDFAKRVNVPYFVIPVDAKSLLNRKEKNAQLRADSFAKLQESFSGCELTEEEIRQECEVVRQQMFDSQYAE